MACCACCYSRPPGRSRDPLTWPGGFLLTLNVARSFVFRVKHELETSGCHFASMAIGQAEEAFAHQFPHQVPLIRDYPRSCEQRGSRAAATLPSGGSLSQRCRLHRSAGDGSQVLDRPGGTGEAVRSSAGLRSSHKAKATQEWLAQNHSRPRAPGHVATHLA